MSENEIKEYDSYVDPSIISSLRSNGEFDKVYEIFLEKHKNYPKSDFITTQLLLSLIDYKPCSSDELKELSDLVLKINGKEKCAYTGYVMYYLSINDVERAYEYYKKLDTETDKFLINKILVNINDFACKKEFRDLTFEINRALSEVSNPEMSIGRYIFKTFDIAEYYYKEKEFENAIKYYKLSCAKRYPRRQGICFQKIGKCYYSLSDYESFKENYLKALKIEKQISIEKSDDKNNVKLSREYYKIVYDFAYCLIDFGQYKLAQKCTEILDTGTIKDKNMSLYLKGRICKNLEKYDEAIKIFKYLIDNANEDRKYGLSDLVRIYSSTNDSENAHKYLDILYKDYTDINPSLKLSCLYDEMKNEEIIEFASLYLNTKYDAEARYYLGRALCRLRRFEEAKEQLDKVKHKITKTPIYFELAVINEKLGNYNNAYKYYNAFINVAIKRRDKVMVNKGLTAIIDFLNNQYDFELALKYIDYAAKMNPDNDNEIKYLKGIHYYRRQDYETAISYFKQLYGTDRELDSKHYLSIIYRYLNDKKQSEALYDELSNTEYRSETIFDSARNLVDKHTKKSLSDAYNLLLTIDDNSIKTMVIIEKIVILLKLEKHDLSLKLLEEARLEHEINKPEYERLKSYILIKTGKEYLVNLKNNDMCIKYAAMYNPDVALENIIKLNHANVNKKELYLTDGDLADLFHKLNGKLVGYNYYVSGLYDVYIIKMNDIVGRFYDLETNLIEVKCEINTMNIHMIQPTLKRINATNIGGKQRKKTDLDKN